MIKQTTLRKKNEKIVSVRGRLFHEILESLPPYLSQKDAQKPLDNLYDVFLHLPTGSIGICNRGASLHTKTPQSKKDYVTFHVGFIGYMPSQGPEIINVGIIGNLSKSKSLVLRPESACAPSFLYGSQRCNCYDQWILARELAGDYNEIELPNLNAKKLEEFLSSFYKRNNQYPESVEGSQAFMLMHFDSQDGMGSGALNDEYNPDLTATAFLRHRGEYTAEQIFSTTMAEGFTSIGISPDPRRLNDCSGYKTPLIVLDYFGVDKPIIVLTNNEDKTKVLEREGYTVRRISFFSRADSSCSLETEDRRREFGHKIPKNLERTLEEEFERVKEEINHINSKL